MKTSRLKGAVFAALAGIFWGTYGTFVTFLTRFGFSETTIAVFAPVSLILFFFVSLMLHDPKGILPTWRNALVYFVVGVIGVLGTNLLYAMAIKTGIAVGVASVLTFTNYFLVMIFSRFIWKVKITAVKLCSGIAAIFGIALLIRVWLDLSASFIGIMLMLGVALTFAISYVLTNVSLENFHSSPDAFYFWINLIGFLLLLVMNPPGGMVKEISSIVMNFGLTPLWVLAGYCLIPQAVSYFCLSRSWAHLDPPSVVIMYSLDPVVAAILGFCLLGQTMAPAQIAGMVIVIVSLVCLQVSERKLSASGS